MLQKVTKLWRVIYTPAFYNYSDFW